MKVTAIDMDDPRLLLHQGLDDCWLTSTRGLLVQTATPGIDPSLFGEGQGVVISTCDLPNGLFQRDPQELVQIPSAQIWKAQLAMQR